MSTPFLSPAELAWEQLRAALIVRERVDTPEVRAEIVRARDALIEAMENDSS